MGVIDHLENLLALAELRTHNLGQPFVRDDYKWVLGVNVINSIETSSDYAITIYPDCPRTMFGIVVERDCYNPDNIQLWENITDKI